MDIIYGIEFKEPYRHISNMSRVAINLIDKYFSDKVDKGGHLYREHLLNVAENVIKEGNSKCVDNHSTLGIFYNKAFIVALLHDILEDTELTREDLVKNGIDDEEILDAIEAITRRKDEQYYFDFIERVSKNDIATLVKIYDLENNMDIRRLNKFEEYEQKRLKKYWYCWKFLKGEISYMACNNTIHPDRKYR